MGKYESDAGNDKVKNAPAVRGLWVGREVNPLGGMLHVATGADEAPSLAVFDALRADALNQNITLPAFWATLSAACPAWAARVATRCEAAGWTQQEWRQAARDALIG